MFKIGQKYEFRVIEGGDEVTFWGSIERYEHPLIKLADTPPLTMETQNKDGSLEVTFLTDKTMPGRIINVTSPNFVSAEEWTD